MMRFLAIDFGTSYSSMAWFNPRTGQAEVIRNAEGDEKTPSVVYYGPRDTVVGKVAELKLEDLRSVEDPDERMLETARIVRSVKRNLSDRHVLAIPGHDDLTPVDVVADILRKLKRDAEAGHFHEPVKGLVLTCPAIFDGVQQRLLKEAAARAGFDEVELLEEPVAAASAYAEAGLKVGRCVLVYDLGGGTFDLAIVARDGEGAYRLAMETDGDSRCGGDDFDRALYDHWEAKILEQMGRGVSLDGSTDPYFLLECRRRKEQLSGMSEPGMFSSVLPGGKFVKLSIDRATFDGLVRPTVARTAEKTRLMVSRAKAKGLDIDTVVLIGGGAKVPLVKEVLARALPVEPRTWQYQDVAVALGAAWTARGRGVDGEEATVTGDESKGSLSEAPHEAKTDSAASWEAVINTREPIAIHVGEGQQFSSIGAALRREGIPDEVVVDRVVVHPGTYRESVEITEDGVVLVREGPLESCAIVSIDKPAIRIIGSGVSVSGLTFRALKSSKGGTISVENTDALICNCDISTDRSEKNGGIYVLADGEATIIDSKIHDCDAICIVSIGVAEIVNCEICGSGKSGVILVGSNSNGSAVKKSKIHGNGDFGVIVRDATEVTIDDCDIHGNRNGGIQVESRGRCSITGNRIRRCGQVGMEALNNFTSGGGIAEGIVVLGENSRAVVESNEISDCEGCGLEVTDSGYMEARGNTIQETGEGAINIFKGPGPVNIDEATAQITGIREGRLRAPMRGGILIGHQGNGSFSGNVISGCQVAGIMVNNQTKKLFSKAVEKPVFRSNRVNGNKFGVVVAEKSCAHFESNDVSGNRERDWAIDDRSDVTRVDK